MGKSSGKMPSAPNPFKILAAQNNINEEAIKKALQYQQIKTKTPLGSVEYKGEIGSPDREKEYKFSPEIAQAFKQENALKKAFQDYALEQLNRQEHRQNISFKDLPDIMPIDDDKIAKKAKHYYQNQAQKIEPYFNDQAKKMEIRLGQKGFSNDSHAYKNAQESLYKAQASILKDLADESSLKAEQSETNAFSNRMASRTQQLKERFLASEEPIKKLSWAMNLGNKAENSNSYNILNHLGNENNRVQNNGLFNAPNIASAFQQNYFNNMQRYKEKAKHNQEMIGGLFSLGKSFLV